MKLKELRMIWITQKYLKVIVEKTIEKALAIPQEQLRNEKLNNNDDIFSFISTSYLINSNVFPKVREIHGNL